MGETTKFLLDESQMPKAWYNMNADMPVPMLPPLHPDTKQPVTPEFLSVFTPLELMAQDMNPDRYIEIPEPVRDIYKLWRPTPFYRAHRLEQHLQTPAHIYYKYEGTSPVGSHKPNTAVAQAFYAKEEGIQTLTTETGAGQWGSALSMACHFFGIRCEVYMVRISYNQKPYRRYVIETYGGEVYASPSDRTAVGRRLLAENPEHPGALGIAVSEGIEAAQNSGRTKKYSLGSFLPHVMLHQTIIGEETLLQMEMAGEYPDIVIACAGGGSNFGGFTFPFIRENIRNGKKTRIIAAEPAACPTLTKGSYTWDWADTGGVAPICQMYTLGHSFVPATIHAGGLRYHGMSPQISALVHAGHIEAVAIDQLDTFEAGDMFAHTEGILPAPESNHAIRAAINEAVKCRESGDKKVIAFNLSGHGHFDMTAYADYHAGKLQRYEYPTAEIERAMQELPEVSFPGA
jgi:tryptophan synthase beta chain